MYSLLIAIFTILISIFITKKFAAYLGLAVKLKSLYICASCALAIVIIFPLLPAMWSQYNLLFILCIALGAAGFITNYNEKLILTSVRDNRCAPNEPQKYPDAPPSPICATVEPAALVEAIRPSTKLKKLPHHLRKRSIPLADPASSTNQIMTPAYEPTVTERPIIYDLPTTKQQAITTGIEQLAPTVLPSVAEPTSELSASTTARKFKKLGRTLKSKASALVHNQPDLSTFTTLDALLDYAEQQKQQNCYENAIFAFKQALLLYKNDEYAPFIVIELGNFYKNTGLYDEAIVIYSRAYSLPSVINNDNLQQEFKKNITYLRIVKTILGKHNYSQVNFADIPASIMQEIENSFTLWYSQKHVS